MSAVDVSVLTPVLDEERDLDGVIANMLAQRFDGGVEFLFIDGGSTDRSADILEAWRQRDGRVRVLRNPARWTPHALNIGLRGARGEFVARMDAHTHYPETYLARGVERLRAGDAACVLGPQIAVGEGRWSRRVAFALATPLGVGGARFRKRLDRDEWEVDTGFTGIWRRDTLLAQGGWDEDFLNDQDTELAARLRAAGGRVVCVQDMAAAYIPRNSLRALSRQYARYGRYRVKTSRLHPESLRRSQLLPPALAVTAASAAVAPRGLRRVARAGLALYASALLATSAAAAVREEERRRLAASLPVVYATMHFSYGCGFLAGCAREGVPVEALRQAAVPARPERPDDQQPPAPDGRS